MDHEEHNRLVEQLASGHWRDDRDTAIAIASDALDAAEAMVKGDVNTIYEAARCIMHLIWKYKDSDG